MSVLSYSCALASFLARGAGGSYPPLPCCGESSGPVPRDIREAVRDYSHDGRIYCLRHTSGVPSESRTDAPRMGMHM